MNVFHDTKVKCDNWSWVLLGAASSSGVAGWFDKMVIRHITFEILLS